MNVYLTIMVTVLVLTQIIRVTQNAFMLRRQRNEIDKNLSWIKDNDISERDFETQRAVFKLLFEKLSREVADEEEELSDFE